MNFIQMSLAGAIIVVMVTIIRALFMHRIPKKTFIVLWGIAICRLLLPFEIAAPISIFTVGQHFQGAAEPVMTFKTIDRSVLANTNCIYTWHYTQALIEQQSFVLGKAAPTLLSLLPLTIIWLVGMVLLGLFFAVLYIKQHRKFSTSLPLENEFITNWLQVHKLKRPIKVRVSDRITSPLTYGIFKPVILLPKNTDWSDEKKLRHILAHEFIHIKRFDALTKLLMTFILCVHWFNPLVWVMHMLLSRDLEISCDAGAIKLLGEEAKSDYALTLIGAQEQRLYPPLHNAFGKYAIVERVNAIMQTKKASFIGVLVASLLVAGIAAIFATSAVADISYDVSAQMIILTDAPGDEFINAEEAAVIGRMAFLRYFVAFAEDWETWADITFLMTFSCTVDPYTLVDEYTGANAIPAWLGLIVVEADIGLSHTFPYSFIIHAKTGEMLNLTYTPQTKYNLALEAIRLEGAEAVRALFNEWNKRHPGLMQGKYNDEFIDLALQTAKDLVFFDSQIVAVNMRSARAMASGLAGTVLVEYAGGDAVQLEFLFLERELIAVKYIRMCWQ